MDCDKHNLGSSKTMMSLGGKLIKEYYDNINSHCLVQVYVIDVDKSINDYENNLK